ncbi:MAG: hypothetical protein GWO78_03770 [Dehalococcoidales bacterium]|nr:hypothetical protein [Dehalococcoidales bacterium]
MENTTNKKIINILLECINESLDLIRLSIKDNYKISDKNNIKGDNPVTDIDHDSQNLIIKKIKENFPSHGILGEEGNELESVKSDYLWIIDPIDGTKNFINQLPLYCVSIAVFYQGTPLVGSVGIPWDSNAIIYAIKDEGIKSNFSNIKKLDNHDKPVPGIISFAPTYFQSSYEIKKDFYKNSGELRNLGATALEIALVANGNAQLALSGYAFTWDFAAGWILIKESNKGILYGNMENNKWEDINPWNKFFSNGHYDLKKMKNWRGKFVAFDRGLHDYIINNINPNGKMKKSFFRRILKSILN